MCPEATQVLEKESTLGRPGAPGTWHKSSPREPVITQMLNWARTNSLEAPPPSQVVLMVKSPPASAGDVRELGSVLRSGRPPGGGNGNPLQCSCLENPMDRRP